jgi:hypothetical protein
LPKPSFTWPNAGVQRSSALEWLLISEDADSGNFYLIFYLIHDSSYDITVVSPRVTKMVLEVWFADLVCWFPDEYE